MLRDEWVTHEPEEALRMGDEIALMRWPSPARLTLTTDSFVVDAVEFPGGDIGKIAVCGGGGGLCI